MSDDDRFGLRGDPEIQSARRVQFGRAPLREEGPGRKGWLNGLLLLALLGFAANTARTVPTWEGHAGALLAAFCALAGLFFWWRVKDWPISANSFWWRPSSSWWLIGYTSLRFWTHGASPAGTMRVSIGLVFALNVLVIVVCYVLSWREVQRGPEAPKA